MSKYKAIKHNNIIYVVDMSNDLTSKDEVMKSNQPYSGTVFIPSSSKLIYDNQVIRHWVNANIYPVVAESCQLTGQFLSDIEKYGIDSKIELIDGKFVVISNLQTLDYQGDRYTYDMNRPVLTEIHPDRDLFKTEFVYKGEILMFIELYKNGHICFTCENGVVYYRDTELHDCYLVVKTEQLESEQEVVENDEVIQTESFDDEFLIKVVESCLHRYHRHEQLTAAEIVRIAKENHQLDSDMISAKLDECDAILYWFDALSVQDKIELYRKYNQ